MGNETFYGDGLMSSMCSKLSSSPLAREDSTSKSDRTLKRKISFTDGSDIIVRHTFLTGVPTKFALVPVLLYVTPDKTNE